MLDFFPIWLLAALGKP